MKIIDETIVVYAENSYICIGIMRLVDGVGIHVNHVVETSLYHEEYR